MKHLRLVIALGLILGTVISVVAGQINGYQYYINGYEYRVGGYTSQPSYNAYIYAKTTRTLPPGSPDINFQGLALRERLWSLTCPEVLLDYASRNEGDCTNCKETNEVNVVPPLNTSGGFDWIAVSKHKLVDTRALNALNDPPSFFFTEEGGITPSTNNRFKGHMVNGCNDEPIIPFSLADAAND